jgi:hypothetical protein
VINRRIAITPIHLDLTGRRLLRRLKTWTWDQPAAAQPPAQPAATQPPGPDRPAEVNKERTIAEERRRERR